MKRISWLALLLALVMMLGVFAGCASEPAAPTDTPAATDTPASTDTPAEGPVKLLTWGLGVTGLGVLSLLGQAFLKTRDENPWDDDPNT